MFLEKVYSGRNQWYYYVFTLLLVFFLWQFIGVVPLVVYTFLHTPDLLQQFLEARHPESLQNALVSAMQTNTGLALTLLAFVFGIAGLFLGVRYIHGKQFPDILTGRTKLDFRRILFGAGIWAILSLLAFGIQYLNSNPADLIFQFQPKEFFILLLISLTLLPLQASFEELLFRGYLMQWAAYLFKYRWIAWLLTGTLFGFMHAANPEIQMGFWVVMLQYILMGLLLSYVAIKDDGLELALGLHIVNNFLAAITVTSDTSALQTHALFRTLNPETSYWDVLITLISAVIFIVVCNLKYKFFSRIDLREKISPSSSPCYFFLKNSGNHVQF